MADSDASPAAPDSDHEERDEKLQPCESQRGLLTPSQSPHRNPSIESMVSSNGSSATTLACEGADPTERVVLMPPRDNGDKASGDHLPVQRSIKSQEHFPWWKKEFFSWLMSIACLACVIGTLLAYQDREIPRWRHGITLNTVVAVVATVERLFLEAPIASSLAQLKWNCFDHFRRLIDFVTIEKASQGPLGSLKLIGARSGGLVSMFGALLLLTSLAIPPFLQQTISYRETSIKTGQASISTRRWLATSYSTPSVEFGMALYGGFGELPSSDPIPHSCPTGNCTWGDYESLAVCGSCNDVTDLLDQNGNLPHGFGLHLNHTTSWHGTTLGSGFDRRLIYDIEEGHGYSFSRGDRENSILQSRIVSFKYGKAKAEECLLSFCTAVFNATEENGHLVETRKEESRPWNAKITSVWAGRDPAAMHPQPEFCAQNYQGDSPYLFTTPFHGSAYELQNVDDDKPSTMVFLWNAHFQNTIAAHYFGFYSEAQLSSDPMNVTRNIWFTYGANPNGSLEPLIQDAADRMTRVLRSNASMHHGEDYSKFQDVIGAAYETKTLIRVRWGWITLPVAVEILVLVFLFVVMTDTRRRKLNGWRNENLFSLFHGPEESLREDVREMTDIKTLEKFADSAIVRLGETDKGWRLTRSGKHGDDIE